MADTLHSPGDATQPGADGPETEPEAAPAPSGAKAATSDGADEKSSPGGDANDDANDDADDDAGDDVDGKADDDAADEPPAAETDSETGAASDVDTGDDTGDDTDDDTPAGPYPTRVGWVVAAFLFFWPLAIPALVQSMRTAEANGTGNTRRAKKSSIRTLDLALGAVTVGVLGIVGLAIGIAAAPTYASSLPPGFVSAARSFVPPALAGPLGMTLPDDGTAVAAPTPSPTPTDDPYAQDPYAEDPYADPGTDPYAEDPVDDADPLATPEAGGAPEPTDDTTPPSDTTATTGAEIPDLQVGDCIDTTATSGQTTLYRIPVVSCTTAHGGEIYAETTASDGLAENGGTPTQQALWDAADAYCYPQFARFVGMRWARSELLYWPIAPSEESWAEGDRRILCVVESDTPVTGSLRGAER